MAHACSQAASGGPLAALHDGDLIDIDIPHWALDVHRKGGELRARLEEQASASQEILPGLLRLYAEHVGPASRGAVLGG